jgi:Uma2 family endonuclease
MRMAVWLRTPLVVENDADLIRVSRENPGYRFEREEDGTIVVSPTHTKGGAKSLEAAVQLYTYAKRAGGRAFDSSTGFAIGPAARLYVPDASWVSAPRIQAIAPEIVEKFWPLSPDIVIEVASDSDSFADVVAKIERYIERGTTYAVAIDPRTREVVARGTSPADLALDCDAIIDA